VRLQQALLLLFLPALLPGSGGGRVEAQKSPPQSELQALRISTEAAQAFRLDGLLTEAAWGEALPITSFTQYEPAEGEPATEGTQVLVLYDDVSLFIGIRAMDSEPDRIVKRILQRDRIMQKDPFEGRPIFAGDDAIAILLDPFDDNRNAYIFATNPNGAEFDESGRLPAPRRVRAGPQSFGFRCEPSGTPTTQTSPGV